MAPVSTVFRNSLITLGVAIAWLAVYRLNDIAFEQFAYSPRAYWIFLPAALRVLAVLLFDGPGVVGLALGEYLVLPHQHPADLPFELLVATSSALAPLVAIALCRTFFDLGNELSKLRGWHVIMLSIANAAANSVILNTCLFAGGEREWDMVQMASIFVGDMLGTAIVLAVLTVLIHSWLRLHRPRY